MRTVHVKKRVQKEIIPDRVKLVIFFCFTFRLKRKELKVKPMPDEDPHEDVALKSFKQSSDIDHVDA